MRVITQLNSGNIVEIITSDQERMSNENWLEYIKTAKAKSEFMKHISKMEENQTKREVTLEIEIENRRGLMLDITQCIKETETNVLSLKTDMLENGKGFLIIVMEIDNKEKLQLIKDSILKIESVYKITEIEE